MAEDEQIDEEALQLVHLRNEFYRDSYRRVVSALLGGLVILGLMVGLVTYKVMHPPAPKYFAIDGNGRITPIVDIIKPNMDDDVLLQWAAQAAVASYSYNYVNYRKELQAASVFFTPTGWRKFQKALEDSRNLVAVKERSMIVTAVPTGAPFITRRGVLTAEDNGEKRFYWTIEMPMKVIYQSTAETAKQEVVVTMTISRISIQYSATGIGIESIVVTDKNSDV